jgi:hypothetical protein
MDEESNLSKTKHPEFMTENIDIFNYMSKYWDANHKVSRKIIG